MSRYLSLVLAVFFIFEWVLRVVMIFVVPHRRKPSSANAWLLLIMIAPTLGTILYYMFGDPKLPKLRRQLRRDVDSMTEKELKELRQSHPALFARLDDERQSAVARLATKLGGLPPMGGNSVEIISDYDAFFYDIIHEINQAKDYVHLEFFIIALDKTTQPFLAAIERAVQRGVKVRVLYDRVVSRHYPKHRDLKRELLRIGADVHEMLPLQLIPGRGFTRPDLRNHRKIVVIDGLLAYSGSQNLIDKTYHRKDDLYYEEAVMKCRGPIVWQYNNIFRADWYAETRDPLLDLVEDVDMPKTAGNVVAQVLPSGPAHDHNNNLKFYTSMVHAARQRVGIVVPYFIPDESFLDAIIAAAHRGVKVVIINSESIDKLLAGHAQRSYYDELLEAGVQIYLYKKPVFLHTKQVLIDDDVAIIGSSNLDIRSFELDLEINTIMYDKTVVKQLKHLEENYLKQSQKVTFAKWQKRPKRLVFLDRIARLTAALQ